MLRTEEPVFRVDVGDEGLFAIEEGKPHGISLALAVLHVRAKLVADGKQHRGGRSTVVRADEPGDHLGVIVRSQNDHAVLAPRKLGDDVAQRVLPLRRILLESVIFDLRAGTHKMGSDVFLHLLMRRARYWTWAHRCEIFHVLKGAILVDS